MTDLIVASIQFNVAWSCREQIRLFDANLTDLYRLVVVDNSTDPAASNAIRDICGETDTHYLRVPGERHEHPDALNHIAGLLRGLDTPDGAAEFRNEDGSAPRYLAFVDHDVFPRAPTSMIDLIRPAGFFGIGQRHGPTGARYIKPSFALFDRAWLAGRALNFDGIRAAEKADDGDCGSMLAPLFSDEDWARMARVEHGYKDVREMDDAGLQSWSIEVFGKDLEWAHLFNLSRWLSVPDPDGREALVRAMVEAL